MSQRTRIRTGRLLPALALAFLAAACAPSAPATGSASGDGPIPSIAAADLHYTCGAFAFGPDVLVRAGQAELADNAVAAALRAHLAQGPEIDFLPDHGWILAGMDASSAEFVTIAGDLGMKVVTLSTGATGWHVTGWGDCRARRVLPAGLGDADWVLAPGQPPIGPDTRTFQADVTERACASGRSSEGRIAGPEILAIADKVLVTFAVRPLGGDVQTCPSNPPTRVTVDLGEPLGDRLLRDGGTLPLRDPTTQP